MQEILKHLEDAINECNKKLGELAKDKKEYEAKFQTLSELEIRLREQGVELDKREKKVSYVENIVEYNASITKEAERVKKESVELAKGQTALQVERVQFDTEKKNALKEIADGKIRNQKQAEALITERKEFDDKIKAYKAIKDIV